MSDAIRNSTKAIIIKDGMMLFGQYKFSADGTKYSYLPPGGGQNKGETLEEAVVREVFEETGATIVVKELLFVREYIEPDSLWGNIHQVEFFFRCELLSEIRPALATEPDELQVDIVWLPITALNNYNIYPTKLKESIQPDGSISNVVYMGRC